MKRTAAVLALFTIAAAAAILIGARSQQPPSPTRQTYRGWPGYGGGPEQIRYSRLDQINRTNVKQLEQAWTLRQRRDRRAADAADRRRRVLYALTPTHKTFALRAATGEHLWTFDSGIRGAGPNRGVMYWSDGETTGASSRRSVSYVYALDAATGKPIRRSATAGADRSARGSRTRSRAAVGRASPRRASSTRTC